MIWLASLAAWLKEECEKQHARADALAKELEQVKATWIDPLRKSDDDEEAEAIRQTPDYVLYTRAAHDSQAQIHRDRLSTLQAEVKRLRDAITQLTTEPHGPEKH